MLADFQPSAHTASMSSALSLVESSISRKSSPLVREFHTTGVRQEG
jgi:hypothetical protein